MAYELLIGKDVTIKLRDGSSVCADIFRPDAAGGFPVIVTLGPYPKDVHFRDWVPAAYEKLPEQGPYMHWETVNPEWWVPNGYAVARADTRGSGKSPGRPRHLSRQEAEDFYDVVEWLGTQPWCNGKVAVMGVSYFAMNAWRVAALRPPHLAAVVPWEGAVDLYRDVNRHGGIFSNGFTQGWARDTRRYQHASAAADAQERPRQPELFPELFHPALAQANPRLEDIEVPLLSAGNWGGPGLHLRGNLEGYAGAGSAHKQLRVHVGDHVTPFYSLEGRLEQLRFLEQWLKGVDTGVIREPPVKLAIRHGGERHVWRYENEWPIARTQWTPYYLDASAAALGPREVASAHTVSYGAEVSVVTRSVQFSTEPFTQDTEVTGPVKLRLWVSSTSGDADLFVVLRNFGPDGREVTYKSTNIGQAEIAAAYGWLRVSHRKLDPARSLPFRPYHTHDELQKLAPGEIVPVEVEIMPTSAVFARAHRLVLQVGAEDDPRIAPFLHDDPRDRDPLRSGSVVLHAGGAYDSHLLLPIIPPPHHATQ